MNGKKNGSAIPGSVFLASQLNRYGFYLFQSFLDSSANLCWIADKNKNLVYANIALLKYFNLNQDAVGKNLFDILPADVAGLVSDKFELQWKHGLFNAGIIKTTSVNGQQHVFSIRIFKLNGIEEDELFGGIAFDISEHYETEQKLFECNEKWLAFTHNAFQGVWEWEVSSEYIHCNESLKNMIGFDADKQCTVEDWISHIHPSDITMVRTNIQKILMGEKITWEEEYRFITKDNSIKTLLDRGLVIMHHNKPFKLIGSILDISGMKDLEHQLVKERRQKEQEIAMSILQVQEKERTHIGHELHDNVGQLITTAKLIIDMFETVNSNQAELKQKSSAILNRALDEIRTLSKELAMPQLKANGLHMAIAELAEEIEMASALEITYTNEAPDLESLDSCKKVSLFRIVQEQLKNVIKHAHATSVQITIKERHGLLEFEIKDDGVGFDTYRVRRGVGLSSIFERTKICNGNMKIESSPGAGTRLLVVFPLDDLN